MYLRHLIKTFLANRSWKAIIGIGRKLSKNEKSVLQKRLLEFNRQ